MKYIIDIPDKEINKFIHEDKLIVPVTIGTTKYSSIGFDTGIKVTLMPYGTEIEWARKQGQDKAWELALKLDIMSCEDWEECFNEMYTSNHKLNMSYEEVSKKYEAWKKEKDKIHIGDEIEDGRGAVIVVTHIGCDGFIDGMDVGGTQFAHKDSKNWTKTGRHFNTVEKLFQEMKG